MEVAGVQTGTVTWDDASGAFAKLSSELSEHVTEMKKNAQAISEEVWRRFWAP